MEIGLDLPSDDEVDKLAESAYTLAVAQFGPDPDYERIREIFYRLLFEGERIEGDGDE